MNNYAVMLAGSNGSGKSTPLKQLYECSEKYSYIEDQQGRGINATFLEDMNTIVLGKYAVNCGGCDGITGNGGLLRVSEAIDQILKSNLYGTPIFFEGLLLCSYVNVQRLKNLLYSYNYNYLIVHCNPELETCLARIQSRNGGKAINESNVKSRWQGQRNVIVPRIASEKEIAVYNWRNDTVPKDDMMKEFLDIVGNWLESMERV